MAIRDLAPRRSADRWFFGIGASIGLAVGWVLARRTGVTLPGATRRELGRLEDRVAWALATEPIFRGRELTVGALTDGIVELVGTVRDEAESDRAVAVAQSVPGVRTVLNRLDLEIVEDHLAETRQRLEAQDPGLRETHWYGFRVGTGRRRQGAETDPDRPDDRVRMVTRELGANRAIELASERLDKMPPGVEGHTTVPGAPTDRGRVDSASHRRLGNIPPVPLQDLQPGSGIHENVKKGTELTLEESGLERELIERDLKDRS